MPTHVLQRTVLSPQRRIVAGLVVGGAAGDELPHAGVDVVDPVVVGLVGLGELGDLGVEGRDQEEVVCGRVRGGRAERGEVDGEGGQAGAVQGRLHAEGGVDGRGGGDGWKGVGGAEVEVAALLGGGGGDGVGGDEAEDHGGWVGVVHAG